MTTFVRDHQLRTVKGRNGLENIMCTCGADFYSEEDATAHAAAHSASPLIRTPAEQIKERKR